MHEIRHEVDIAAPADVTWRVVGDPGAIAAWLPALAESRLEGTTRFATLPDGSHSVEEVIRHSDAERSYSYVIVEAPLALEGYESTLAVHDAPGGSRVVWSAHFEADDDLRSAIDGMYQNGLESLARFIETTV
ncbi:SRPBCC family protein [Nocardioides sp.]|uniref:SRPBCC family protein n=1 Tax=Nocardioides sp. TaxID=35761 RepID=UPI003D152A4F